MKYREKSTGFNTLGVLLCAQVQYFGGFSIQASPDPNRIRFSEEEKEKIINSSIITNGDFSYRLFLDLIKKAIALKKGGGDG